VIVTDHGDGSLTISQLANPIIEAAEVALTTEPTLSVSYDDAGVISASGSFVAGQQISFELLGKEISFTTSSDDAFEDTLAGVASQMASAINDAGISGVSAAKTASANSVTLAADVVIGNAVVDSSANDFIVTTIGDSATASVALVGASDEDISDATAGNGTAFTFTSGDAYTFEVAGEELKLVLSDADGYTDDAEGVAEQMKDLINGLGLEGLTASVNATAVTNDNPGVDVTRVLTGIANSGSTVVTNVQSLAQNEIGDPSFSGSISIASAEASLNALTRIDSALLTLNQQRASLGAESNRLDHTIDNLSNIEANLQGSRSRIQDADFAAESANLAKQQIMLQAGTAMLAQANASQQNVLSLLG
jgi:flagellin